MKRWQWAGYPVGGLVGACMGIVALQNFAEITDIQPLQISAGIGAILGLACAVWITRYSTRKCKRTSTTRWVRNNHGDSSVIAKF